MSSTNQSTLALCSNCDASSAQYECLDCGSDTKEKLFCNTCMEIHPKIKQFKNHRFQIVQRLITSSFSESTNPIIIIENTFANTDATDIPVVDNVEIDTDIPTDVIDTVATDGVDVTPTSDIIESVIIPPTVTIPVRRRGGTNKRCEHDREQRDCKLCGGHRICEHNKYRRDCRACGGGRLCSHGKEKRLCIECGGSALCIHAKNKWICKLCKDLPGTRTRNTLGTNLNSHYKCEHNREKRDCKECGGTRICIHGNHKRFCQECGAPPRKKVKAISSSSSSPSSSSSSSITSDIIPSSSSDATFEVIMASRNKAAQVVTDNNNDDDEDKEPLDSILTTITTTATTTILTTTDTDITADTDTTSIIL